jgi:hypothetical protein
MTQSSLIEAVRQHYDLFICYEFQGFLHNQSHLPTFAVYSDEYWATPRLTCPCGTVASVFKKTGVHEVDDIRRAMLITTCKRLLEGLQSKYFVRKQKNVIVAAHQRYFQMMLAYSSHTLTAEHPTNTINIANVQKDNSPPLANSDAGAAGNYRSLSEGRWSANTLAHNNPPPLVDDDDNDDDDDTETTEENIAAIVACKDISSTPHDIEQPPALANSDSGATGNYLAFHDIRWLTNVVTTPAKSAITVYIADGNTIRSTHRGTLHVPSVGDMVAYIFPGLKGSLLSISALVNMGLSALFTTSHITILRGSTTVMQGDRDLTTGLWFLDLSHFTNASQGEHIAVAATREDSCLYTAVPAIRLNTNNDVCEYWHKVFGSLPLPTFINAVDKGWVKIPGLTATLLRKYAPNPIETSMGHLDGTRQGLRSTRSPITVGDTSPDFDDDNIETLSPGDRPNIFIRVRQTTGRMHSDAAGRFPIPSLSGKMYMIIFFSEDGNFIHVETTRSRSGPDLLSAFQRAVAFFSSRGRPPVFARMDNECSKATKLWCEDSHITVELAPPSQHRTNRAERAIRTWKSHFISILAGIDPECPMCLWELFIEQAELTLNLMRACATNPKISAWEGLCGKFDLNATPIAPLGTKVVVHNKPNDRESWGVHGEKAFYVGRAVLHYRCFTVWVVRTRMVRISDTLAWHPVRIPMPGSNPIDALTASAKEMAAILKQLVDRPDMAHVQQPVADISTKFIQQFAELGELFRRPVNVTHSTPAQSVLQIVPTTTAIDLVTPISPTWPVVPPGFAPHHVHATHGHTPPVAQSGGNQRVPITQPIGGSPIVQVQLPVTTAPTAQPSASPQTGPFTTPNGRQQRIRKPNPRFAPTPLPTVTATPNLNTAPNQRVRKQRSTGAQQRVISPSAAPTNPMQFGSQITVPISSQQAIRPPPRLRTQHSYNTLSPMELKAVTARTLKCIGKQFTSILDPTNITTGTVHSIVRHKTSKKLVFRYWDHTVSVKPPHRTGALLYMDATYALNSCAWAKPRKHVLAAIEAEQMFRNNGPTRNTVKKSRQRKRYIPWYHNLYGRANSASCAIPQHYHYDLSAFTAQDTNNDGTPLTSTSARNGPDKDIWMKAHGEEIVRLIESKTGRVIHHYDMPKDRKAAYYNPQLKIKIKADGPQYRVRGTIGGDQVHYPGETAAYTASLETIRILLNAIVSEDASFLTADIKDFYLGTPLDRKEYMRISLKHIPIDIQLIYNMAPMIHNDHIIMEISKGIYGLPQAGKLAQDRLVSHLAKHGYMQCVNTPCLFVHTTNGVAFTLVVDDFLIKFKNRSDADHLLSALRELYTITSDFALTQKYVGITLCHNKATRTIDMSMPGYVKKAILRFKRTHLKGADSPIIYVPPKYGPFQQEVQAELTPTPLTPAEKLEMQEIVGVFLFYARAVDPLMLTAINKIGSRQSQPTCHIKAEIERFLQYANKHHDTTLRIRASNMKLVCHSDASYLSESEARSRAGGILFLGDCAPGEIPNAAIAYISVIISTVVPSATGAEYAALFIIGSAAISIRHTLADLGYPQNETEIVCDNQCAVGIAHNTLKQKRTKTIDMRYHWIRDQVRLKTFKVTWRAGKLNLADFFTKAHPVHHHLSQRRFYVVSDPKSITRSEGVLE